MHVDAHMDGGLGSVLIAQWVHPQAQICKLFGINI
jgi:hypothetical protein